MKKKDVYPIQLIKAIASFQEQRNINEFVITARKFYDIAKELESDFNLDFPYSELIDYSKRFCIPAYFVIDEHEIHIHKKALNTIKSDINWYGRMYEELVELQEVVKVLKKLK